MISEVNLSGIIDSVRNPDVVAYDDINNAAPLALYRLFGGNTIFQDDIKNSGLGSQRSEEYKKALKDEALMIQRDAERKKKEAAAEKKRRLAEQKAELATIRAVELDIDEDDYESYYVKIRKPITVKGRTFNKDFITKKYKKIRRFSSIQGRDIRCNKFNYDSDSDDGEYIYTTHNPYTDQKTRVVSRHVFRDRRVRETKNLTSIMENGSRSDDGYDERSLFGDVDGYAKFNASSRKRVERRPSERKRTFTQSIDDSDFDDGDKSSQHSNYLFAVNPDGYVAKRSIVRMARRKSNLVNGRDRSRSVGSVPYKVTIQYFE